MQHIDTAKIITEAIDHIGHGHKGLADELGKSLSIISRYATGATRPKADILLKCLTLTGKIDCEGSSSSEKEQRLAQQVSAVISELNPHRDAKLITTIHHVLSLAKKL